MCQGISKDVQSAVDWPVGPPQTPLCCTLGFSTAALAVGLRDSLCSCAWCFYHFIASNDSLTLTRKRLSNRCIYIYTYYIYSCRQVSSYRDLESCVFSTNFCCILTVRDGTIHPRNIPALNWTTTSGPSSAESCGWWDLINPLGDTEGDVVNATQ